MSDQSRPTIRGRKAWAERLDASGEDLWYVRCKAWHVLGEDGEWYGEPNPLLGFETKAEAVALLKKFTPQEQSNV